jgi:hypothetical protein
MPAHPQPASVRENAVVISGASAQRVTALNGPWKFRIGDSPEQNDSHAPVWAQPNYDDFGWQDYTIDVKHPNLDPVHAIKADAMPGWQQHGYPAYTGYAWYRIRLQLPPDKRSLAVLMPQYVDDAYEVYANGHKIGSFGRLDGWRRTYPQQAKVFRIPAAAISYSQPTTLAIRFWNQRYEALPSKHNLDGGLRGVPLIGPPELLQGFRQITEIQLWKTLWPVWLMAACYSGVGLISLFLFLFSRKQHEYMWAGVSLLSLGVLLAFEILTVSPESNIPLELLNVGAVISEWIGYFALSLAAMYLLGVPRLLWRRATYAVMVGLLADLLLSLGLHLGLLPPTYIMDRLHSASFPASLLAFVLLLLAIAVDGLRTLGRKAWLLLTPGLLTACGLICELGAPSSSRSFDYSDYFYLSVPFSVLVIFLMRFTEQQRENVRLLDDMKQAQQVQQILIPEKLPQIPGLTIESEYRPAREVGGDFFQIIPHATDGSVLIVVGDVTGHGLQAGMLVALIVGAIRSTAETNFDPLCVLEALNRRLCGRGHAYATCLALQIFADGIVTLANAGHLPPYLNGKELPMEGAPPLGMIASVDFPVVRFELAPGDTLVLMSDGVAEARDKDGQLFGFDRIQHMLQGRVTAAQLATAAKKFGHQDDITVVSVERVGQPAIAVA